MPDLKIALVAGLAGFVLGYGVREFISYRRREAERQRRRFFSN
jgi:hypothetical protein